MAVTALSPLGPLPSWQIDGVTASSVDPFEDVFALSARAWTGRPLASADRSLVPVCWTIENSFASWAGFYASFADFVADVDQVICDPQPRFGEQGSLTRRPRAVIVSQIDTVALASPARLAIADLAVRMKAGFVFAGTNRQEINGTHTVIRSCLPNRDLQLLSEATGDDYLVLDVDETQTVAGEVLFVVEDFTSGAATIEPYYDQPAGQNLPLVRSADLDLLVRAVPRFDRVKWLYLQPFSELVTGAAKAELNSFVADAPAGSVEYHSIVGAIDELAGLAEARAIVTNAITSFFGV